MIRKENLTTKSEWFPEKEPPTFNEGANAYQMAIVQTDGGRVIPGFAFGETAEECQANAWMLAASKDLFKALQAFMLDKPDKNELATYALNKAMDELK